jgi:hypothetical protein
MNWMQFKDSKLFKKTERFCQIDVFWHWTDIGLCLRFYTPTPYGSYRMAIEIQVLWLDIWIRLIKKD